MTVLAATTSARLRPYLNTTVKPGARGKAVTELQAALKMPRKARTGRFDAATKRAVVAYQRKKRLPATGTVGAATWHALAGVPMPKPRPAVKKPIQPSRPTVNAPTRSAHAPNLPVSTDPAWHLARRLTYGANATLLTEIRTLGATKWLEQQLNPASINDSACEKIVATTWPNLHASRDVLHAMKNESGALGAGLWHSNIWLQRATETRRVFSKRQLFEMVVEMWHDHLHVTLGADKVSGAVPRYDRDVIRKHAFGTFADMLQAATVHPAMIAYLDNSRSKKDSPNENLARELLELHTVGVGQFTEADVKQAARILTGTSQTNFEPLYRPTFHWVGPVQVMGYTHPNATADAGPAALSGLLTYLAHHPATAQRIALKMCRRFVSDTPSAALVTAVAAAFTANRTAIVPTLRVLFNHPEFIASAGQKYRRPGEYVTALYRAANPTWTAPEKPVGPDGGGTHMPANLVHDGHYRLQHEPLAWPAPNGYPDVAAAWQSASGTIVRANLPYYLVFWADRTVKTTDWATAYKITPQMSAYTVVDTLTAALTGYPFTAAHRTALAKFLWDHTGKTSPTTTGPVGADRIKYRLKDLVRLILASPYMNLR